MFYNKMGLTNQLSNSLEYFDPKKSVENNDTEPSPRKCRGTSQHSDMERALYLWFSNAGANNIPVTDSILNEKAQRFGGDLGVAQLLKWLVTTFQKQAWHNLS